MNTKSIPFFLIKNNYFWILILFILNFFKKYSDIDLVIFWTEKGIIENLQVLFIILGIILTLKNIKLFKYEYGKLVTYFKVLFFAFLLYEETSFLTANKIGFAKLYNLQSELNIHNSNFLHLKIPSNFAFTGGEISIITFLIIPVILLISFGKLLNFKKNFNIFFLEVDFLYFGYFYIGNILFSFFLRAFSFFKGPTFIHGELIELFFYLILYLDSFLKTQKIRYRNKK